MSLSVNNQLSLLMDLLDEQQQNCCAEVAEYQQIKRLVKSMLANNRISDEQLLQILPEIYNYGREGENVQNREEHITTNRESIHQWIHAISKVHLE